MLTTILNIMIFLISASFLVFVFIVVCCFIQALFFSSSVGGDKTSLKLYRDEE